LEGLEHSGRNLQQGLYCRRTDIRIKERACVGDDRHRAAIPVGNAVALLANYGEQIAGRHVLGSQDAIHGIEGKLTPAMQEVR